MSIRNKIYLLNKKSRLLRKFIFIYRIKKIKQHRLSDKQVRKYEESPLLKKSIVEKVKKIDPKYIVNLEKQYIETLALFNDTIPYIKNTEIELKTDILFCCIAYGVVPYEYMMFNFMNSNIDIRKSFLTEKNRYEYYFQFNDPYDEQVLFDKYIMAQNYREFYGREFLRLNDNCHYQDFKNFVDKHKVFVEKPVNLSRGEGVRLRNTTGLNLNDLFIELKDQKSILLEEVIVQDQKLSELHKGSVNAIRCTTVIHNNKVSIFHPVLRMGRGDSFVDNASAGGIIANIDTKTGKVITDGFDEAGNRYVAHPDSKITIKGFVIPRWSELLDFAKSIAMVRPTVRYVGWDLALTKNGWIMIEGNTHGQFLCQYVDKKGRREELDKLI